jgi:hypothetical protein
MATQLAEIRTAASRVPSLVLTDIGSGWTEAAAMLGLRREQTLITVTFEEPRGKLAVPMLGLGLDKAAAFIKQTVKGI